MKFIIFPIVFILVFVLLNLYIFKRFINKLHISNRFKKYIKIFLIINLFGIIGYMFARYNPNIPNWLYFILSLPIGVVFLVFCTAVVYDLSHLAITKIPLNNKRRNFFKKGLDYSSLVVALGLTSRSVYEAKHIELETVDIKLKNLKQPYKIVQLSDIHIGGLIDQKFIKNLVDRVNTLEPDLVVITGDLVDVALKYAKPSLDELTKLKSVYGTYFIVGNHEYFHNIEEIIKVMKQLEITVLENNYSYIGEQNKGFNLAGVYDVMGYRVGHHQPDIEKALKGVDKNSPVVLLAHQPRFIEEVDDSIDLVLSGHTHGGQIYPFRILVKLVQPYIAGLYNHSKHTQIYVNKGTGFWGPPMRLGSSSEITLINIS